MKYLKMFAVMIALTFTLVTTVAYAQITGDAPSTAEWNVLFSSLAGIGGLKVAGIIALVVQAAMLVVRQFVQGKWKLAIVAGLTLIGAIVGAFVEGGGGIASIFTNTLVITAVQVLFSQIFVQAKKNE